MNVALFYQFLCHFFRNWNILSNFCEISQNFNDIWWTFNQFLQFLKYFWAILTKFFKIKILVFSVLKLFYNLCNIHIILLNFFSLFWTILMLVWTKFRTFLLRVMLVVLPNISITFLRSFQNFSTFMRRYLTFLCRLCVRMPCISPFWQKTRKKTRLKNGSHVD